MGWLQLFKDDIKQNGTHTAIQEEILSILIVDDEVSITDTIARFLEFDSYKIQTAQSGTEALEIFRAQRMDIVITDLMMPGMDGLQLLEQIREIDNNTEVIVLTGHGDMNAAIKALKSKATDFLIKPVDLEVLMHSIRKAESHIGLKREVKKYTKELEELFKEVHHSREYLETIIQNSPNATVTYDTDGFISSWNDAAEKITGYTRSETQGKTLREIFVFDNNLIDPRSGEMGNANWRNIISQIITKSQEMRYISRNANILRDQEKKIIGGIESFYDVTEKTKSEHLLEKRFEQVQTINEIGKKVASSTGVDDLIDFISKRLVSSFFESANIFFFLTEENESALALRAASGIQIETVLQKYPLGTKVDPIKDIVGHVHQNSVNALYPDATRCTFFKTGFSGHVKSVFTFPIDSNNRKYGVLHIENAEYMEMDDSDISMMEAIAEYLAISLDKIELLEKITRQNHLLEKQAIDLKEALTKVEAQKEIIEDQNKTLIKDLKKAGDFQKSLLPEALPELENYSFDVSFTPSNQLGGDYYDIFSISDRYIGVMVADASGHGVSSAMLSAMFKMTLGKYGLSDMDPGRVFAKLNHDFCQVLQMGDFFTAFYAILDLQTNRFVYSNAAHPLPLLYNYDTQEVCELDSEGFLLGVMDNGISYEKKDFTFRGRYRLLIYTDGLSEAINKDKVQFSDEKVKQRLIDHADKTAPAYLDALHRELREYTGSDDFEDDLTLVVMDVKI